MPARKVIPRIPIPQQVRRICGSFGWIDHRLLREGTIEMMTLEEMAVYLFLVLAGDRNGVSFYRKDRICRHLALDWSQFEEAKSRLLEKELIAFLPFHSGSVDGFYQVLPLPPKEVLHDCRAMG